MSCQTPTVTKCNRDRRHNVWIEGNVDPETGEGGICLLDTLTEEQVTETIERDERARADLLRVTDDPQLLHLAATVPRLPTGEASDAQMAHFRPPPPPYYAQFKGRY